MKLALFSSRFRPHVGGVENVVEFLYNHITDSEVITTYDYPIDSDSFFKKSLRISSSEGKVHRIWMGMPKSILGYIIFPYRFILANILLIRHFLRSKYDLVNYHFPDNTLIYFLIARLVFQFPYVLNLHGNDLQVYSNKSFYKYLYNYLAKNSYAVVVNSEYMLDEFYNRFPSLKSKCRLIPNSIDINMIESIPKNNDIEGEYIFFVGRLVRKKGADILIKAFEKSRILGLKLVIEGKGDELESLKSMAQSLSISDKVIFTEGKLSVEEKIGYMKGSVFGIVPSRIEPFGIVALEYFASNVPIIASDTGGLSKMIKSYENGLLYRNEKVEELCDRMLELYNDKALRDKLSTNARLYVKQYDHKIIAKKYMQLFEEAI